jgi:hypothetical protein
MKAHEIVSMFSAVAADAEFEVSFREVKPSGPLSNAERQKRFRARNASLRKRANSNDARYGFVTPPQTPPTDRNAVADLQKDPDSEGNSQDCRRISGSPEISGASLSGQDSNESNVTSVTRIGVRPGVVSGAVTCPLGLTLRAEQRATLESGGLMIPGWAIDLMTIDFRASHVGNDEQRRPLETWQSWLVRYISGRWNDPKRRPQKPPPDPDEENRRRKEHGDAVMRRAGLLK